MKKYILLGLLVLFFIPGTVQAAESIESFISTLTIQKNGSVDVEEVITYNFDTNQRHGIYRDIPIRYIMSSGTLYVPLRNEAVTDERGNPYEYTLEEIYDDERIRIGSPDSYVSGIKTYRITYTVDAVNYFENHDELYWNVTGNRWEVPIKKASAIVRFYEPLPSDVVETACFKGYDGSTTPCDNTAHTTSGKNVVGTTFIANNLSDGEGLTVVFGFPKNKVAVVEKQFEVFVEPELTFLEKLSEFLNRPWIFSIPGLVFVYSIIQWWRFGRDPKGRGTIITQFDAPDDLTPAQVGSLVDEKTQTKDISAEIIELAVHGYISITRIPKKGILSSEDYELNKLKEPNGLPDWQKSIMQALFGKKKTVLLSDLKETFVDNYLKIASEINESLTAKGYYDKNPFDVKMSYYIRGAILSFILVFPAIFLGGWMTIVACMSSGFVYMFVGFLMPRKSIKGVEAKEHIYGLKRYLEVAEKDRINFHNAPDKDPKLFEKLLPFAMVLGVEEAWAKQFKDLYLSEPQWYHDPSQKTFNALALSSGLHSFSSSAATTFNGPSRSTASSGGSGFRGGSSGGGFGGGGGGSW